jgi:hypothetical protein
LKEQVSGFLLTLGNREKKAAAVSTSDQENEAHGARHKVETVIESPPAPTGRSMLLKKR